MKTAGRIIKYTLFALVMLINAALIFRVCMYTDNATFSDLVVDETLTEAYRTNGGVLEVKTHDIADIIAEDGSFFAYGLYYVPSAGRLQITVKYNNSTVEGAFGTTDIEAGREFGFVLFDGVSYVMPSRTEFDEKNIYRYALLIFDGVSLEEAERYDLLMYATAAGNYPPDMAYAELPCHYIDQPWELYKPSRSELKALGGE